MDEKRNQNIPQDELDLLKEMERLRGGLQEYTQEPHVKAQDVAWKKGQEIKQRELSKEELLLDSIFDDDESIESRLTLINTTDLPVFNLFLSKLSISGNITYLFNEIVYFCENATDKIDDRVRCLLSLLTEIPDDSIYSSEELHDKLEGLYINLKSFNLKCEVLNIIRETRDIQKYLLQFLEYPKPVRDTVLHSQLVKLEATTPTLYQFFLTLPSSRTKIIVSQSLLDYKPVVDYLKETATDTTLDTRTRADAADVLLSYDEPFARQVISTLSGDAKTVYEDRENVHNTNIYDSCLDILSQLQKDYTPTNYNSVKCDILILQVERKDINELTKALHRIEVDMATYGENNLRIIQILCYVWSTPTPKDIILEQLVDTHDTCSSGYFTRLMSAMVGHTPYTISISLTEQLTSNYRARIQAKMQESKDEFVITDLVDEKIPLEERLNYQSFLLKHLLPVREELYTEFLEFCEEKDDFDKAKFDNWFDETITNATKSFAS